MNIENLKTKDLQFSLSFLNVSVCMIFLILPVKISYLTLKSPLSQILNQLILLKLQKLHVQIESWGDGSRINGRKFPRPWPENGWLQRS